MNGKIMLNGKAYSSSGRPSREITMAQWLALPDTKYTDGIVYYIKDVGGANQFPPLIYSDEEREIGVWRDGKPLYQRSIPFELSSSGTYQNIRYFSYSTGITNIDKIIDVDGYWIETTNNPNRTIKFGTTEMNWEQNPSYFTTAFLDGNEIKIYSTLYTGNYPQTSMTGVANVLYTKTTDTPGSGTWTTDGTYAHHYSTSEKVIGTWIDGKPLYEKAVAATFSDSDQSITVESNIDTFLFVPEASYNKQTSSGNFVYLGFYESSTNRCQAYYEASDHTIKIRPTGTPGSGYITYRYTKTTD